MNSTKIALVAVLVVLLCGAAFAIRGFADDTAMPQAGQAAPDFTLPSQDGSNISLDSFRGKWVVLYFYPKDMTTGCTIEAGRTLIFDLAKVKQLATAAGIAIIVDSATEKAL